MRLTFRLLQGKTITEYKQLQLSRGTGTIFCYRAGEAAGRFIRIKERKVKGFGEIEQKTKVGPYNLQFSRE